jgi:hypothetical protein
VSRAEAAPAAKSKPVTDFERQNAASKKLANDVGEVLDEALTNMVKEVREFLKEAVDADDQ